MPVEYEDWNAAFSSGPHGHIAGTGAYLINGRTIHKMRDLIPLLNTENLHANSFTTHADGRRFIADVYIYSMFRTYVYWNRLFRVAGIDSFINPGDVDWHKKTQIPTLNANAQRRFL